MEAETVKQKEGLSMWYCPSCGTQNGGDASFCTECGKLRPNQAVRVNVKPETPVEPPKPPKKAKRLWIWAMVVLALLAVMVVGYFTLHFWQDATCTQPETCSLCGKTRGVPLGHQFSEPSCEKPSTCIRCGAVIGSALGHDWSEATCTQPQTCRRCGATNGDALGHTASPATCTSPSTCSRCGAVLSQALGHDWQSATYDRPETCSRCGATQGKVKGWVGDLNGSMGEESLFLYENGESHPYILDRPVSNCMKLTLYLKVSDYSGSPFGSWGLYARDSKGSWSRIATFYVNTSTLSDYVAFPMVPEGRPSFEALTLVPLTTAEYNIRYSFYYEDVQEFVG